MRFDEIRPFVRFARKFSPTPANCGHFVVMRDSRLFLLHEGRGVFSVEGTDYPMEPGDCLYIPAGMPYMLSEPGDGRPEYYIINFDFTWEYASVQKTMPALEGEDRRVIFAVPEMEDAPFFGHELFFSKMQALEPMLQELEW